MKSLDNLSRTLSHLPGVGAKSAKRMAYFLLKADKLFIDNLVSNLINIKTNISICSVCGYYSEGERCAMCSDVSRNHKLLCVVEQTQDALTIDQSGAYHGLYHILNGARSPLDGLGPDELNIASLLKRLQQGNFDELIIATNLTMAGEATAMYLQNLLKDYPLQLSRLASGLSVGSDLEYADKLSLSRSLQGRQNIN
jgi:recombination protein RecR